MRNFVIGTALFVIGGALGCASPVLWHQYEGASLVARCGGSQGTVDGGAGKTVQTFDSKWRAVTSHVPGEDRDYSGWKCLGGFDLHFDYVPTPPCETCDRARPLPAPLPIPYVPPGKPKQE